ncbi:acyl transferase 9-like [Typha angustifolia]|uniref:acyl transferase 9-like n=1 Tax=Typha angustifolia TaxID=59011 RepID=UPI003C2F8AD7
MSYSVTKSSPFLIPPSAPTPSSTLPLSSIDKTAAPRVTVEFIQVFRHGQEPTNAIKEAFAKALVYYYPVAGRIVESNPGEPEIECSGEGIWFVEASANCSLEDVNQLDRPLRIPKEELLPHPPKDVKIEDCILLAQVTEFTCGGFTVGICFSHTVFDGQGAAQFMKAVGEMARGLPKPTTPPVWSRESIPDPPKPPHGPSPSFTVLKLETSIVEISQQSISNVKDEFTRDTNQWCSTFDVVTAMLWKCRAKAISSSLKPDDEVRLNVTASTRHLLHDILPSVNGYYGNCVYPIAMAKSINEINNTSLVKVVSLIRDAKEAFKTRFVDWMMGGLKDTDYNMPCGYENLAVSDWTRLGFNEVDYGWGAPSFVFTLNDDVNTIPFAIYLKPPAPKQGIRLMMRCAEKEHSEVLCDELLKLA